ncbi:Photosystem II 10 kDa polypeptide, chloroplastic [Linum perenne]
MAAASMVASSLTVKPNSCSPVLEKAKASVGSRSVYGLPILRRSKSSSMTIVASGVKKIKTDTPYGTGGGMNLRNGVDANGRKPTGKGVYQYVDKYGANVDGYSPIYNADEWAPTGDVYAGGVTGLAIWAVTLVGILAGGALLVYNTSALSQ